MSNWDTGHSPTARHKKASFYCPWVLLDFPDDESYQENTESSPKEDRMRAARKATFTHNHSWPPNKEAKKDLHAPYTLAEAGFFYSPTLKVETRIKCACCQVTINEPKRELNCKQIHRELNQGCSFFLNKSGKGSAPSSQSSQTVEPSSDPPKTKAIKRTLSQPENSPRKLTTTQQRKKIMDLKPAVYSSQNKNNITFGKTKKRILPSAKGQVVTTDIFADLSVLIDNRTPSQKISAAWMDLEKKGSKSTKQPSPMIPEKDLSPVSSPDIPHHPPSPLIPDLMDTIYPEGFLDDLPDVAEPRRTPSPQVFQRPESPHSPLLCFSPPLQQALREVDFTQSTPNRPPHGANVFDIFDNAPFTPIRKVHQVQDTPVMERTRHPVIHDTILHKKKAAPPPLDASVIVPETHVPEEVKSLPVEVYLERIFANHVEKVEGHGLASVQTLQTSSDTIKQHLGSQLEE